MASILIKTDDKTNEQTITEQIDNQNSAKESSLIIDPLTSKLATAETPLNTHVENVSTEQVIQLLHTSIASTNILTQESADLKYSPVLSLDIEVPAIKVKIIEDPLVTVEAGPVTPYQFYAGAVPKMFEFVPVHNQMLDPYDQAGTPAYQNTQIGELPAAKKSYEIFNHKTMVVRERMITEFNGQHLGDPLVGGEGLLSVTTTNSVVDPTGKVDQEVSLILYILRLALLTQDTVMKIPSIINNTTSFTSNKVVNYFVGVRQWIKDDNPNLLLAACNMNPGWVVDGIADMIVRAAPTYGRVSVAEFASTTLEAKVAVTCDQFMSKIFNLNYLHLKNHQLDPNVYAARITANMYEEGVAHANFDKPHDFINLNYSPGPQEWNQAMYMLLVSKKIQTSYYATMLNALESSNRLVTNPSSEVFEIQSASYDGETSKIKTTIINLMAQGTKSTIYELLMFETFHFFEFNSLAGYMPATTADGFIRLISLFAMYLLFPKLSSRITHQLQQTIYDQLNVLWTLNALEPGNRSRIVTSTGASTTKSNMTFTDAQEGYCYYVFSKAIPQKSHVHKYVRAVMDLMPQLELIDLSRKRRAGYPYFMSEYKAHASWKKLNFADSEQGEIKNILLRIIALTEAEYKLWHKDIKAQKVGNAMSALFRSISLGVESIGSLFHYTLPRMQELLMNSFGYVYDDWTGNRLKTPQLLGVSRGEDFPVPINYIRGIIDPTCTLRMMLTVEGDYARQILKVESFRTNYQKERRFLQHISGFEVDDIAMRAVVSGRKMASVIRVCQMLLSPDDDTNPIQEIANAIAPVAKRSTFNTIVTKLTTIFQVDYDEIALETVLQSRGDVRRVRMAIVQLVGAGVKVLDVPTLQGKFDTDFCSVDTTFLETLKIITNVLFTPERPVAFHRGRTALIGKYTTDELHPNNVANQFKPRIRNSYRYDDLSFTKERYHHGQTLVITAPNVTYSIPFTETDPFEIVLDRPSDIPTTHRRAVAEAIVDGKIYLRINEFDSVYDVIDWKDRVTRPNTKLSVDDLVTIFNKPNQAIHHHVLYNSKYATNNIWSVDTVRKYEQFLAVDGDSSGNVHCSLLTNSTTSYTQSEAKLPDYTRYAYGAVSDDYQLERTIGGVRKIDLPYINWNNDIYCVDSDAATNLISIYYKLSTFTEE